MAQNANVSRGALKVALGALAMFGFGFLLAPLYDVFCDLTGLNGKTSNTAVAQETVSAVAEREITVQFTATNNANMVWEFKPRQASIRIHPGQWETISYFARNPTDQFMVAQATPSVSPSEAAAYLKKAECFCFNEQPLEAGAQSDMPLVFTFDPELPEHIRRVTISYTSFDITAAQARSAPDAA